jgi:hypothetical protein
MALLAVSAVAVVDLLAASAVAGLLAAVSAREGLLVVVDFVGVGVGAQVGAGGDPASMAPIAGGVRVAAVGSAHTIDRRAVGRGKWERRRALPCLALPLHVPANRESKPTVECIAIVVTRNSACAPTSCPDRIDPNASCRLLRSES